MLTLCTALLSNPESKEGFELLGVEDGNKDTTKVDKLTSAMIVTIVVIELVFLIWGIMLATKCAKGKELTVHLILAILFPVPYVFGQLVFADGCSV